MIDYNLIVYIGIGLIVLIFVLFIANEMDKRKKDIELFKQQQLTKSFNKTKLIPMTEEEEYRNAGITKKEINENNSK